MTPAERIEQIVQPTIHDLGYAIVRVTLMGKHNTRLQIMAEPLEDRAMTVDDCAIVSRSISALLDVEEPISGSYQLEVSSPGLDRPLLSLRDFKRFAGYEAFIETFLAIDGQKRFPGKLRGVEGSDIVLDLGERHQTFKISDIRKAQLIVTENMLANAEGYK